MAAPAAPGIQPMNLPALLAKGINFDHIFNPYRDPKEPYTKEEQRDIASAIKEAEFSQVAGLGFTHIRLNLGQAFLQEPAPPFKVRPEGLELLDRAVGLAGKHDLAVILDMHQIPVPDLAGDGAQLGAFRELWRTLAERYKGLNRPVLFELLNEPRVKNTDAWRAITVELIGDIRKIDPNRAIVVTGAEWGGMENLISLGNLKLPNLVYTFHFYEPFAFTHQGATWGDPGLARLRGIRYPIDPAQMRMEAKRARTLGSAGWPFEEWMNGGGKEELRLRLNPVLEFGKKEGLVLYCGEFGVHKPYAPPADRAHWIADMRSLFEENGVGWGMWAYHSGFDLVEDDGKPVPAVITALGLNQPK